MGRRFSLVGALISLLTGCFGTVDISHKKIFNGAVGAQLVTKRETFLFHWQEHEAIPRFRETAILEDLPSKMPPDSNRVLMSAKSAEFHIPSGQAIRVSRVEKEIGDGIISYYALGEVYVPSLHRFVAFRYSWGDDDKIFRAPWEGNEVPLVRRPPALM